MIKKLHTIVLPLLAVVGLLCSCENDSLTDGSAFSLHYPGVTDIGPSTNLNINPSWHGEDPTAFSITSVTLDGQSYETECFTVDPESGVVSIHDTDALPVGLYAISIECQSAGKRYTYKDAITVKMMRAVPEGISVEPNPLEVKLIDVVTGGKTLPTAQVTTQGEHISITGYKICGVKRDGQVVEDYSKLFKISLKGVISIVGDNPKFEAGSYSLDLKLNTIVAGDDSSEGIFEDALTINITSVPLSITYTPAVGRAESGYEFVSPTPVIEGSKTGLNCTLKSVTPEGAPVTVDALTGTITVAEGNTLAVGQTVTVSLTVANAYGSVDFDDAYTMEVVAYVHPISEFAYSTIEDVLQGTSLSIPVEHMDGDFVTYSWAEALPEALSELQIDAASGTVSAPKDNSIPVGTYSVPVKAENTKNSMTADVSFTVVKNPYFFTYFRYGNNLSLTPASDYADQFRITQTDGSITIPVAESDIPSDVPVKWTVEKTWCSAGVTIDAQTGELTVPYSTKRMTDFVTVQVTVGGSSEAAITMRKPVFFNHVIVNKKAGIASGITITYTPFVLQCNPKSGGRSVAPVISGTGFDPANFAMDYRRSFNYFNLNGPESHINGQPAAKGFLYNLWTTYFAGQGKPVNTGSRDPMSAFSGSESLRLGYVDQSDFSVVVNPNKFRDDAGYANGVFTGQIIFGATSGDPSSAFNNNGDFPLFVWFDTQF